MKKVLILLGIVMTFVSSIHTTIAQNEVQRVRVDLETPLGYTRQLLLGFTPDNAATDGFDYGYDGANVDDFPDDFNWMIDDQRYIIQGVGAFDELKKYPIGFFLTNAGSIKVTLNSLENFNTPIPVYLYDKVNDDYTLLNDSIIEMTMASGEFTDRFYLAFMDQNLSVNENNINNALTINFAKSSRELTLSTLNTTEITEVNIFDILGHKIVTNTFNYENTATIRVPNQFAGVYVIEITTTTGIIRRKVLL